MTRQLVAFSLFGLPLILVLLFVPCAPCAEQVEEIGEPAHRAISAGKAGESEQTHPFSGDEAYDPAIEILRLRVDKMVDARPEEECLKRGKIRYHGKCMETSERDMLFEWEIRHVEALIGKAHTLYQGVSLDRIAMLFKETEEFVQKFESDTTMDRHMEEKMLLLLGFLYVPADELNQGMSRKLDEQAKENDPFVFLKEYGRMDGFSRQVYIPLMRLLGRKIDAYVIRHGREEFDRLMADNNLSYVLRELE